MDGASSFLTRDCKKNNQKLLSKYGHLRVLLLLPTLDPPYDTFDKGTSNDDWHELRRKLFLSGLNNSSP